MGRGRPRRPMRLGRRVNPIYLHTDTHIEVEREEFDCGLAPQKRGDSSIDTCTHTHTYIYLSIYLSVDLYTCLFIYLHTDTHLEVERRVKG